MTLKRLGLAALIALLFTPAIGEATTLVKKDLAALSREAEAIVIGRVTKVASRWDADRRFIVTDTTLQVESVLAGTKRKTLTLTEIGGRVDDITCVAPLMPTYKRGQRLVVFAKRDALAERVA